MTKETLYFQPVYAKSGCHLSALRKLQATTDGSLEGATIVQRASGACCSMARLTESPDVGSIITRGEQMNQSNYDHALELASTFARNYGRLKAWLEIVQNSAKCELDPRIVAEINATIAETEAEIAAVTK